MHWKGDIGPQWYQDDANPQGRSNPFSEAVQSCVASFRFLVGDLGFRLDKWEAFKIGFEVRYKSATVGARFSYRHARNFLVLVSVLVENGEFPVLSGELRPDSRISEFDLEDIEALNPPSRSPAAEQAFDCPMPMASKIARTGCVSVEGIYHWQDTIHPDQKHHPDPWLNTAADLLTVGAADPYRLDLSYRSQARYAMDATGSVHEMEGYPAS